MRPLTNSGLPGTQPGGLADQQLPTEPLEQAVKVLALLDPLLGRSGMGIGSNSWVISGGLTASGMPLLANDPHLAIQMPSIWYQIGMHCQPKSEACPYEIAGFSFAGVPGVIIGHNDRIAWGMTNNGPDVMDLYYKTDMSKAVILGISAIMTVLVCLVIQGVAYGEIVQRGVVLLVEFPDVKHDVGRNFVQERFSRGLNSYESRFLRPMSFHLQSPRNTIRWFHQDQRLVLYGSPP
jgi:hypothetical protein